SRSSTNPRAIELEVEKFKKKHCICLNSLKLNFNYSKKHYFWCKIRITLIKTILHIFLFVFCIPLIAQTPNTEGKKKIEIVYGGDINLDEQRYPGATIFNKDEKQQVQFRHEGADMWCDLAVLYRADNRIEAYGNVYFQQGDSIRMNSAYVE